MAIPPIIFLGLAAAGLLVAKKKRSHLGHCDLPAQDVQAIHAGRNVLRQTVQSANLAPTYVMHWDGTEATVGAIQIIWESDGPWGPACEDFSIKSILLAEAPLAQKTIPVDTDFMFSGSPWGGRDLDVLVLPARPSGHDAEGIFSKGITFPVMRASGHRLMASAKLNYWPRSWLKAEVEAGGDVWTTGSMSELWDPEAKAGRATRSGTGEAPQPRTASAPHIPEDLPPTAYYGFYSDENPYKGIQSFRWEMSGPLILALLRPNSKNQRVALSMGTDGHSAMVTDPANSDVLFVGPEFLTQSRINEAVAHPVLALILDTNRPGEAPRPVDVLLWLAFTQSHPFESLTPTIPLAPGSELYYQAIGNEDWEVWADLYAKRPGFRAAKQRFLPDVSAAMGVELGDAW